MTTQTNTGTRHVDVTWKSEVLKVDPDFERAKRTELQYEFSNGRQFHGDPTKLGPYAGDV